MSKVYRWDDTKNIVIPGDQATTIEFCVKHFIYCATHAIETHGKFFVALSGGTTPIAVYTLLSTHYAKALDWSKVYLFWSDERSVPPDHPESNYLRAMNSGLGTLPIPSSQIFRMQAEEHIKDHAKAYETLIHKTLHHEPFDLIILGMGDDGHTASLFPNTEALHEKTHDVVANYVPQKKTWRMTMTFKCINEALNIALYVLGDAKKETFKTIFYEKDPVLLPPSAHVGSKEHPALWILDQQASSLVLRSLI